MWSWVVILTCYKWFGSRSWGQGEPYVGKPIAAFLEFARQQDLVETQLELRGQLYGQLTAKPLLTNPTGPRPEKRNDGFNRKGPQGLQNVTSKASTMLGELPPPPPLPPRIATDPLADVPPALPLPKIRPVDQATSSASHVLPPVHPFPPLPPPFLIPGLPVDLSYGPVPPPPRAHAYPPRVEAPYYRPKAKSRYPWKEPERATWVDFILYFFNCNIYSCYSYIKYISAVCSLERAFWKSRLCSCKFLTG